LKGLKVRGVHIFRYRAPSMRLRPNWPPANKANSPEKSWH
jgi:hypothetical protein